MNLLNRIKDKVLYRTEYVGEELGVTPWRVTKLVAKVVGASMASYVVGSVLRNNMPEQPTTIKVVKTAVGIYLLQSLASSAVERHIHDGLCEYDFLFEEGGNE